VCCKKWSLWARLWSKITLSKVAQYLSFPFVSSNELKKTFSTTIYAIFVNMECFLIHVYKNGLEILRNPMHHCRAYKTKAWTFPRIMSRSFPYKTLSNRFVYCHDFTQPTAVFGCRQRCYIHKKCIFLVTLHNTCSHEALLNYQWWAVVLEIRKWSWLASEKPCDISQKLRM
jgi:hypothetical protein